jgi:hypothetical protein
MHITKKHKIANPNGGNNPMVWRVLKHAAAIGRLQSSIIALQTGTRSIPRPHLKKIKGIRNLSVAFANPQIKEKWTNRRLVSLKK